MKKIISLFLAIILLICMIPVMPVLVYADEKDIAYVDDSQSFGSNTGNAQMDKKLNDYGFNVSLDSIEGYDESNGDVENSPFGTNYVDNYTLQEAFYFGAGKVNNIYVEANTEVFGAEVRPDSNVVANEYQSAVLNEFIVANSKDTLNLSNIDYAETASGDFSRDARNSGIAMIFVSANDTSFETYLAVFNPLEKKKTPICIKLSEVSYNSQQNIEDFSSMVNIAVGNYLPGSENEQNISPDEVIVNYPVQSYGKTSMITAVYSLTDNDWQDISKWAVNKSVSTEIGGKHMFLTVGDVNEDGFDDVVTITSYGISKLTLDKKIGKSSNTLVNVWYGGSNAKTASTEIVGLYRAGGTVTDINNDGKPNLVLCGINDISKATSTTTLTDISVALEANLKETMRSTKASSVKSDLTETLNKTLRQQPVVIKSEQHADHGGNAITDSLADSQHCVMYDGMFVVAKTRTNELRFADNTRETSMKSGEILTSAYSGMIYATTTSVSRDEVFMCYTPIKSGSTKLYPHPDATEFTRKVFNTTDISGGLEVYAFTLANVDYDSGILRYDGWSMNFTDPELHAVLAAAPYFGDFSAYNMDYILEGETSYSFSSSHGNGLELEWNVGETAEFNALVVKLEGSFGYQGSWSRNYNITQSSEFSASKESVAVVATIPVEVYSYTLFGYKPGVGLVEASYKIPVTHEKVYSLLSIPEYDKAASKNGKDTLTGNVLIHQDGDPSSYNYSDSWIKSKYDADSIHSSAEWYRTNTNTGSIGASIEIETEDEESHGFYVSGSITGGVEGVGSGGVEAGFGLGAVVSEGKGTGYSASVRNLTKEMDGAVEGGYGFQWKMKTFNAKVDGNEVPVIAYEVKNCSTNPRMPLNVSARGYETFDSDGNRIPAVKVSWEANPGEQNADVSYAIMRKHPFTGALQTIGTVPYGTYSYIDTNDLEFGTEYEYAVRVVKNVASAPYRYGLKSLIETAKTHSEYGAPDVSINSSTVKVSLGTTATMGVTVKGELTGRKLEYQWMKRIPDSYAWTDIDDEISANYSVHASSYLQDDTEYRCIIMETIVKPDGKKDYIYCYSDVIKLKVE